MVIYIAILKSSCLDTSKLWLVPFNVGCEALQAVSDIH
jgi:hypothetical protein